jgi:hypothetical protein
MVLKTLKNKIQNLIAQSETLGALDELLLNLSDESDFKNNVVIQKSWFVRTKKQFMSSVIAPTEQRIELSRINSVILAILEDLQESDIKQTFDTLTKDIQSLGIKRLPKIALVNCDRKPPLDEYKAAFKRNRKLPYQFYFITACPTQQPGSFAERVIYEILSEVLDGDEEGIHYERDLFEYEGRSIERVRIASLPYSEYDSLEENKIRFRKHFAKRMQHFEDKAHFLEEIVAHPTARPSIRFFSFLFKIDLDDWTWNQDLADYLDWLIQTFKTNRSTPPTYKFIFILSMRNAHIEKRPQVEKDLEILLNKHHTDLYQPCVRLDKFDPVKIEYLAQWFSKWTNDHHLPKIEKIVSNFSDKLRMENRFHDADKSIDMADLEELLLAVYAASHQ